MKTLLSAALVAFALLSSSTASAGTITFNLTDEFSNASDPQGPQPWLTATFTDNALGVLLTMNATNLVNQEFVHDWVFNFNDALDLNALSIVHQSGATSVVTKDEDNVKLSPSEAYDIKFDFANGDLGALFATSVYQLSGPLAMALDATDFNFIATGGPNDNKVKFSTAAHIGGIGPNGNGSGKIADVNDDDNETPIPTPEPSSAAAAIFGLGALGLAGRFVRK
jgi:hypothetical protein